MQQLNAVLSYVACTCCRRVELSRHFGLTRNGTCRACDVCRGEAEVAAVDPDTARKLLKLVKTARCKGFFEISTLARVFTGSSKQKKLKTLPWFGNFAEYSSEDLGLWLQQLVARGLLAVNTSSRFRVPTVTSEGLIFCLTGVEELSDEMRSLYTAVQKYRARKARAGKMAAWKIFPDSLFKSLMLRMPTTREELEETKGWGKREVREYGDDILSMISAASH